MTNQKIINACLTMIDKYDGSKTLYELLNDTMVEGLTFAEVETMIQALDNYFSGAKYYFQGAGEAEPHDMTPYNIVNTLYTLKEAGKQNSNLYYQVTAVDRWGYNMGCDSNAEWFDNLLMLIVDGKVKEAFDKLNDNGDSGFNNVTYEDIASGKANNNSERIIYDDFTYIMTASSESMTIYKKAKFREE